MTLSLPIADSLPHDAPTTPASIPSDSRMPLTFESVQLDEGRWNAWRDKGRLADIAFAEKMRSVALMGVVVAGAVGTLWIALD